MDLELKGKKVFISGSTSGIGFAAAKKFLEEGACVIINGRTSSSVKTAVKRLVQISSEYNITGIADDFGKKKSIDSLLNKLPRVDILINNVGVYSSNSFFDSKEDEWQKQFEVNIMSGVRLSKHFMPQMLDVNSGRILFISSECAFLIPPDLISYSMSKAAILAISRGLAQLTKGTNVTVNTLVPGSTLSEGAEKFLEKAATENKKTKKEIENTFFSEVRITSLLQRFAKVEEVANMIVYLSSPLASATNGAVIKVDGGSSGGLF
jgi:NAD(P)-dependent dehydrogenase (short-subunit alcohol dehydrogenase family)